MKSYKAYCLDLDGTMYRGKEPIQEAVDFVSRCQAQGAETYFITNNAAYTRSEQQQKLAGFGVQTDIEYIMNSPMALAKYCKQQYPGARVMMIGEEGLEEALAAEQITVTTTNPDVVMMGLDRQITYSKLSEACLAIRNGAHFLGANPDYRFPTERGLVPGNGSFLQLMEAATDTKPFIVGKPEPFMLQFIQQQGNYAKEDMVLIGDNYDTDILAGIRYGIDTAYVSTGVTPVEELLQKEIQPTYVLSTLADWGE
ncbi:TIGR01457 family HAD-type hydrolase [Sporosarcina sp. GW1-11]|uniref:TIGR01457 family HAD-type hydrolase n=1 Tax=Sporosarcina sp. GW1-11 TaxID=2899126 RepID=UPI00294C818B|nr:TIGR01457 family HAD-type hydrolase [Sporosarcina sp. GW1-11]MDV6378910.1 TIGR01457 family HAD-type hydrolase [Sporosarcina sp. GW1-11]